MAESPLSLAALIRELERKGRSDTVFVFACDDDEDDAARVCEEVVATCFRSWSIRIQVAMDLPLEVGVVNVSSPSAVVSQRQANGCTG